MPPDATYIHALRYSWLNWLYDPVVRFTTRESTIKSALIEYIPRVSRGHVLDLGCGTGTLTRAIASRLPEYVVCGIDGDRAMLGRAQEEASSSHLDICYDYGLAQELPYDDSTFDVVTSTLLFHHLTGDTKRAALVEIRRVLVPSGILLIADWGRPQNRLMRVLFYFVQLLDGFETTADSLFGMMPAMMREAGLDGVQHLEDYSTLFGTISIYRGAC